MFTKCKKDQHTLEAILEGNEKVINAFYQNAMRYVGGFILQRNGNQEDVEDVVQEALMALYQKLNTSSLRITVSLQTYFFSICKNKWKRYQ